MQNNAFLGVSPTKYIEGLYESLGYQIDIDLIAMIHRVAQKLKCMTREEFLALDLRAEEE